MLIAVCLIAVYVDRPQSSQSDETSVLSSTASLDNDARVAASQPAQSTLPAQTEPSAAPSVASAAPTATTPSPASSSPYKDGTYTKTANYTVPRDQNSITVTITIKDGVITNVSDQYDYSSDESKHYIGRFDSAISGKVVGQKLGNVSLSRVGGASLTTGGFASALSAITKDAKA